MTRNKWNEGLNCLPADLVDKFITERDKARRKNKIRRMWLRIGAMAACLAVIISAVITAPMLAGGGTGVVPPIVTLPNGDNTTVVTPPIDDGDTGVVPPIVTLPDDDNTTVVTPPIGDGPFLSADQIAAIFGAGTWGTNQYEEVYAGLPQYLYISPIQSAERLPVFSANRLTASESGLRSFIEKYIDGASELFGVDFDGYKIEQSENIHGETVYSGETVPDNEQKNGIRFIYYNSNSLLLYYSSISNKRMKLDKEFVSVLESDTDEQIKEKLSGAVSLLCATFDKEYTDMKIIREYTYDQLMCIRVYLYTPEKTVLPEYFSNNPKASSYIMLSLYTDLGGGNAYHWDGSKDEAFLCGVNYYEAEIPWDEYYTVSSNEKMLTLAEAEELLNKGYVFGNGPCPQCTALQPEVDFSDYNYVDMEYLSDRKEEICVPFYAFYKYIGETKYGIPTYAKTYVPAVEVSGLEEYFQLQHSKHTGY